VNRHITIRPKSDSQLGQLLERLETVEAKIEGQRQIVSALREAYTMLQRELRRANYALRHIQPPAEQLAAMEEQLLELMAKRDFEDQKLTGLLHTVRELQARWDADYREFLKLHNVMADLQRLGS
jgi:chromosome segregation ATPase